MSVRPVKFRCHHSSSYFLAAKEFGFLNFFAKNQLFSRCSGTQCQAGLILVVKDIALWRTRRVLRLHLKRLRYPER